jgi:twinkle protein
MQHSELVIKTWEDFNIDIPPGSSGHIRTLCPECSAQRNKSKEKCLSVDIGEKLWLCHHCGFKGSLNNKKDFEIIKYFKLPKQEIKTNLPINMVEWFKKRGISESTLLKCNIGYGNSKDIQFPYYKDNKIVNIKHRAHPKNFWQEKDAEKCLYRFDDIRNGGNFLIITEGEVDCLSFIEAGYSMVTSIPDGAPSVTSKEFHTKFDFLKSAEKIIELYDRIILATDSDKPGQLVENELARRIGPEKCFRVEYPNGCKDANESLIKNGIKSLENLINNAKPFPVEGLFSAIDFKSEVENLYNLGVNRGLSTGWGELDDFYTVKPNEITIVTGIPGAGKSNFIDNLAVNMMSLHDWKFLFFSPENWPVERHLQSLLEKTLKQPFSQNSRHINRMSKDDVLETLEIIGKYLFFVYPKDGYLKVDEILEKAKVAIYRHGINGVIIDPWNEIDHDYLGMNEAQYLSKSLSKIRQFAKRNAVHIWIVAHPKNLTKDKDGNYNPPTMYEISGGAHWRNKADNGLCLHRPDYKINETNIYIQKIRFKEVGKTGEIKLHYSQDVGNYI